MEKKRLPRGRYPTIQIYQIGFYDGSLKFNAFNKIRGH